MALPSLAATYNVNGSTGSDSNTCTQALSPSTPKATISGGLGCESGADTVVVFAGTYSSGTIPAGTGSGSYNSLTINGADVVNITGAITLNSHTKVSGLVFNHTGSCFSLSGSATDVFVGPNNNLTSCSTFTINSGNSFIFFQGNTWAYAGCVPPTPGQTCGRAINVFGSDVLIESNDFSHYQLGVVIGGTSSVDRVMIRNNTFHDQFETEAGSNHHTDSIFSEPATGVTNVLEEGNLQRNAVGANAKAFLSQDDSGCASTSPACDRIIARYNVISRIGSGGVTNDKTWPHVKVYNNTWVDANEDASTTFAGTNNSITAANAAYLNDIYYYTQSSITNFNPYYCNNTNCSYGHNLYWCTGSCTQFHSHTYGSGNFTSDPGNLNQNPLFVSYVSPGNASNDYHLQSGSPARNAGTRLTTVNGTISSSTSLVVADANYFQDGYGLQNTHSTVTGDCISVTTVGNHVCITAVNYATNTLTLASAISATNGDPVWLYSKSDGVQVLTGTAPDIGALPFTSSTPALQLSPSSFNYGNVVLGGSSSIGFTLTNIGGASATVSTITYTGTNSGDFSTQSQTCGTLPATLGAGLSCTINVLFTPGGAGSRSGTLNVTDTPDSISATAGLSGTGIAAAGGATVNGGIFNSGTIN